MTQVPESISQFLGGKYIAVAGVSRHVGQAASAVFQKLTNCGYEVFPVNPNATEVEGVTCSPDIPTTPEKVDGVVIATAPDVSVAIVRQCIDQGVRHVWFHRSFGKGSVSE